MITNKGEWSTIYQKQRLAYCGIDIHKDTHTAVVIDCWMKILGEVTFENRPRKFDSFVHDVKKISGDLTIIFGLEDTRGLGRNLAIYLTGHQFMVKHVNPAYTSSARLSAPTVFKNDSYDAFCVARTLRDMIDKLPDANHQDIFWTIRQLIKRRDSLSKGSVKIQNQLHGQLLCAFPSYRKFFTLVDCKTALYFWEHYPSYQHIKGLTPEELGAELRKIGGNSCSTNKAQKILSNIEADGDMKREYQSERDFIVKSIVKEIRYKQQEIIDVDRELQKVMAQTGYNLESMPGISLNTASHIVSEIGDINRFSNADKLARFAGVAPVSFSSAGKGKEQRSRQGNRVLNAILYFLAVQLIWSKGGRPRNPMFYEYFHRKVSEGKKKSQALVCIQRRLINIIYGMMKNKREYRPVKD